MEIHYFGTGAILYNGKSQIFLNQSEYITYLAINENFCLRYNAYYENRILDEIKLHYRNENIAKTKIREIYKYIEDDVCREQKKVTGIQNGYYPQNVVFFLTNRCLHCFRDSNCYRTEMCIDDALKMIEVLKGKVSHIVFSGGEPLLHANFSEIVKACTGFFSMDVVSSLYLTEVLDFSLLKNINKVQVTIYGSNAEEHDGFVNKKGSFAVVCENISQLIRNGVNITLSSMNNREDSIEKVVQLAIKLGVKELQFGEIEPIGRALKNKEKISFYKVSKSSVQKLQLKYRENISILYDEGCGAKEKGKVCGAGLLKYDIDEMGNVYPCLMANEKPIGNTGNI